MSEQEQVAEQSVEDQQQALEQAFADGFNDVRGEEPEAPKVEPKEEPKPDELAEIAADEKPDPWADYTPDQIKGLLAKAAEVDSVRQSYDKLAGHVGTLLQKVKTLETPAAKPEKELPPVNPDEFMESYPEFASYLRQEMAKVQPPSELVERLNAAEQRNLQLAQQIEERTIDIMHPDWRETVSGDGYKVWLATQAPEVQKVANETQSAMELGRVLAAYKQSAQKSQVAQKNQKRLEAALAPEGVPAQKPPEPSEQDAFAAGWNAVRRHSV